MTNDKLNDFTAALTAEVDQLPLIAPKAKALIAIAVEVAKDSYQGQSSSLVTSINNALQKGVAAEEIEELWLLLGVYRGFNQVSGCFDPLNQIVNGNRHMISAIKQEDYAQRDRLGKIAFYVLLWKRKSIDHELFYNYWKNVHGPLCAHLPGQHQYWQFHLDRHKSGIWPMVQNVENTCSKPEQFDGIAELTFASEADFQAYIQAFDILMADEHNLFSKAIAYNTNWDNSHTYIDRIPTGTPNGELDFVKFHVMVKKSATVTEEVFRQYMTNTFAAAVVESDFVIKFRLHLLETLDNSRPSNDGVCRYESLDKQYQAAFEIAFVDLLAMEKFLASPEYEAAVKELAKYIEEFYPFPEHSTYTFVYDGKMTLAGQRSSHVVDLILQAGATNQLQDDVAALINGSELKPQSSTYSPRGQLEINQSKDNTLIFSNSQMTSATATESNNQPLLNSTKNNSTTTMLKPLPGQNTDLVKRLFSRGEAFDSAGIIAFFTDNPVYQFANFDVCLNKEAIKKSADNFFSQIDAVYHEIKMMQEVGDVVFVEMDVYYWRKDGSMIVLPCCDIFRVAGDKFSELRIFMDVNPLFDPSISVSSSASVFTASQGKTLIPPGTMKKHFAEHPEGKQLVADGYVPKWSIAGPKWTIAEPETNPKFSEQLNAVGELSQAIMAQDWAKIKTYLTDDIFYKVGSAAPRYGRQEVVDFFRHIFKTTAIFTGHKVRKVWQESDIIAIEMDAYYQLVPTGKQVTVSCCDIYRMRGNKVSEWRVYVDMSPWQESTTNGALPKQTVSIA